MRAGLGGELRQRTVVVEARHRGEALRLERGRVLHRDQRVGVGRVADHEHAHIARGDGVERFTLRREDLRVGEQQVLALHAGAARACADQQRCMAIFERDARIIGGDDLGERRERAVVEFHHDALQRRQRRCDLEQVQVHRLVGAEQGAGGDAEGEGIADLAGGAGDRNIQRLLHRGLQEGNPLILVHRPRPHLLCCKRGA